MVRILAMSMVLATRVVSASLTGEVVAAWCLDDDAAACDSEVGVKLLQVKAAGIRGTESRVEERNREGGNLALMHIPFNFGHTIERVALLGGNSSMSSFVLAFGSAMAGQQVMKVEGGEVWGRMNRELNDVNNQTGCVHAFSPAKYWPEDLAEKHFGGKAVFGMLRDPYERLVAFFRGDLGNAYGGSYPEFIETCDVNSAVRKMMLEYKAGSKFKDGCTFVPQAEFFEGKHGVTLAVDNRLFPASFNKLMVEHGYDVIQAQTSDLLHVSKCNEVWAGDLDCETRALVQEVYADDFKLLCDHFGYCDQSVNCCIHGVPQMCPQKNTSDSHTIC